MDPNQFPSKVKRNLDGMPQSRSELERDQRSVKMAVILILFQEGFVLSNSGRSVILSIVIRMNDNPP